MKSHEDVLRLQLRFYSWNKSKSERMNTRYARPGLVKILSSDTSCLIRSHVPQNRILDFPDRLSWLLPCSDCAHIPYNECFFIHFKGVSTRFYYREERYHPSLRLECIPEILCQITESMIGLIGSMGIISSNTDWMLVG